MRIQAQRSSRPLSKPQPSTCGTATYRAAHRKRRASLAKSAVSVLATLMNSLSEMPQPTRKVTPPSPLTQAAGTDLPAGEPADDCKHRLRG